MKLRIPKPHWIFQVTGFLVIAGLVLQFGVPGYRQHVAIRELERRGGQVMVLPVGPAGMWEWTPATFARAFGVVISADLTGSSVTDSDLKLVKHLRKVKMLSIKQGPTRQVNGITLEEQISEPQRVTDAGVKELSRITSLESLGLEGTDITDAGLVHLKDLTKLEDLWLDSTKIAGPGLKHLTGLTRLRLLSLGSRDLSDIGLEHLQRLTSLQHLLLNGKSITDNSLVHLKGLTNLKTLRLVDTDVTDAGLVHLRESTSLEGLLLQNTNVTDAGVADLTEALPGLTIVRR